MDNEKFPILKIDNRIIKADTSGTMNNLSSLSRISMIPGSHSLESSNDEKFGLTVYGYNNYDGYGYAGGMSLKEINCGISRDERFSLGLSISYPLAYGGQLELGYRNII